MQTVDENFHRHVTAKRKMSKEIFTDTFPLPVKSQWLLSATFYIQKQNVDGIFHRHFVTKRRVSTKISIDISLMHAVAKCRRNFTSTFQCRKKTSMESSVDILRLLVTIDKTLHRMMSIQISIDVSRLRGKNRWIYLRNKNTSVSIKRNMDRKNSLQERINYPLLFPITLNGTDC